MLRLLFILFLTVPLAELYVLIQVGGVIGALPTIGLCVLTAALGAVLIRAQGLATALRIREQVDRGEVPALTVLEGAFLVVSGLLLLTPGLITDVIGFLCLVPALRRTIILAVLGNRIQAIPPRGGPPRGGPPRGGGPPGGGARAHVIEGEYTREPGGPDAPPADRDGEGTNPRNP